MMDTMTRRFLYLLVSFLLIPCAAQARFIAPLPSIEEETHLHASWEGKWASIHKDGYLVITKLDTPHKYKIELHDTKNGSEFFDGEDNGEYGIKITRNGEIETFHARTGDDKWMEEKGNCLALRIDIGFCRP